MPKFEKKERSSFIEGSENGRSGTFRIYWNNEHLPNLEFFLGSEPRAGRDPESKFNDWLSWAESVAEKRTLPDFGMTWREQ